MGAVAAYALPALLACLCLATAAVPLNATTATPIKRPNQIPDGKIHVYKYLAVVSTGQNEPAPYASKFQIQGKFLHRFDSSDPDIQFVKYAKFHDIKHTIHNGQEDGKVHGEYQVLQDAIKDFEEPILVVCDGYNKLVGVKIQEKEAVWSRNMKKSLATILQLDFSRFEIHEGMQPTAFETTEKTIHGVCQVDYSVYVEQRGDQKVYVARKAYEPRKCDGYVQHVAHDARNMHCKVEAEEDFVTSTERVYEFEYINNNFLVKKIFAHEKLSYMPWLHRSFGVQYIETSQTFEFEDAVNESELKLPSVDFKKIPLTDDVTFDKTNYVNTENGRVLWRHATEPSDLIAKVKEVLISMVDLSQHSEIENVLYSVVKQLDSESMHIIYNSFSTESEKEFLARKIFLEIVPHTGTYAAWKFTKDIIQKGNVPDERTALDMLANLPMYIPNPNETFTKEMIDFQELKNVTKSVEIAGVLTYSILLHKTYKDIKNTIPAFLSEQLEHYNQNIKSAQTYQLKILYIMAMRNVEVGNVYQYLAPIVRGEELLLSDVDIEKPEKYRTAAMWAVGNSISDNRDKTFNLFWPILSNKAQPLSLRVTAYEFLIPRNPLLDMNLLMSVHWLMLVERDEHLFNYHYTTMANMAESTNPCMISRSEMMRKVLRLTNRRKVLSHALSHSTMLDYFDTKYGHGRSLKLGVGVDEASGFPQFGHYEVIPTFRRRPMQPSGVHWNMDGINLSTVTNLITKLLSRNIITAAASFEVADENVKNLLRQTHAHKLLAKQIHVEFWNMNKGYITNVQVFSENNLLELLTAWKDNYMLNNMMDIGEKLNFNWLDISYYNRYLMIVATDIGIPAIFSNEVPQLWYIKLKPNIYQFKTYMTMKLKLESKFYHHSLYKMIFYNPFADVTHSVERHVTTDGLLPADLIVSLNLETYNLKIVLPRTSGTKYSVTRVRMYSVDQVRIGDTENVLKTYCPTCKYVTPITKGPMFNYEDVVQSADTGLEYTFGIFNCEIAGEPNIELEEWARTFRTDLQSNDDGDVELNLMMIMVQRVFNFMNVPYRSSCGTMLKIAPSPVHPTSHIEMNWRFNAAKPNRDIKLDVRGSIDSKSTSTNETVRSWNVNMNLDLSRLVNHLKLQFTRKTPKEKNLKICLEAEKTYSEIQNHETNTAITFSMGQSDDEQCVLDEMLIKALVKARFSDEQAAEIKGNAKTGSCNIDSSNPLDVDITQRFDWNCLNQAIKTTTLRKYSAYVTHKKVPHEVLAGLAAFDDYVRFDNFPYISYSPDHTTTGSMEVHVNYSSNDNYANVTVMNPSYSYKLQNVLYGSKNAKDRSNDLIMDNIGFSTQFLVAYYRGDIRPCIAHAHDIITDMNQTIPMDFKNWTLMSGDHELMTFAVFVRTVVNNTLALKVFIGPHVLEIQPLTESSLLVLLDGAILYDYTTYEENYLRMSMINKLLKVETLKLSQVVIYYSPDNVVILPHVNLNRNIDGMCGHMGSSAYVQEVPLIYG